MRDIQRINGVQNSVTSQTITSQATANLKPQQPAEKKKIRN